MILVEFLSLNSKMWSDYSRAPDASKFEEISALELNFYLRKDVFLGLFNFFGFIPLGGFIYM